MRKYVYCPMSGNAYDTEIQFDTMQEALNYSEVFAIDAFAVLDALSLEYYYTLEITA